MYILTDNELNPPEYIFYMPPNLRSKLLTIPQENLLEIRLRRQKPITLYYTHGKYYLDNEHGITTKRQDALTADSKDIERALERAFEFSLYAHEDELLKGFITIKGGHRIGLCGEMKSGKIRSFCDISSLNYRIAHEHIGIGEVLIPDIVKNNTIKNTLIISPPMRGKTSLIRDIARLLSLYGFKVAVCDTRYEIASQYEGIIYMDVGDSDILSGAPKADGINMLLRTMSPDVIICDEIGEKEDVSAILHSLGCGSSIIATAHSASRDELYKNTSLSELVTRFDIIVTLGNIGEIAEVYYV